MKFLLIYVPNLRFPQFIEPWNNYIVSELLTTFPTNSLSWDQLVENQDSSLKNLHYGLIHNGFETTCITGENQLFPYIKHSFIPTKYASIQNGDLILADASEDRKDVGKPVEMLDIGNQKIVSGLHTIHARNKTDLIVNGFKGFYFQSSAMKQQIFKIANGSKIYGISSSAFNELKMFIPEKQEQKKIIDLMIKIEERIQTQSKIIKDLKIQKAKIRQTEILNVSTNRILVLNQLCNIKTGKKDANQMKSNGTYKFFTCSREDYYIDTYSFEGDSLIISGNGEIGLIKYYSGKFDAYQRTYVLQNFECDPLYLKLVLEEKLPKIINKEKNVGAMPYIVLSTLSNITIPLPDLQTQTKIQINIGVLDKKIKIESQLLNKFEIQKKFLLNNMFI